MKFTYQTRFETDEITSAILDEYAQIFNQVERKLFADIASGKNSKDLKSSYLQSFQITARQYNAIRTQIEGKIASSKEKTSEAIASLSQAIAALRQKIKKRKQSKFSLHQKKRRLLRLEARLQRLKEDHKKGKIRICFGSKKLFREQFHLEENNYRSHTEWKKDWENARNSEFFVLGSKDETAGNQSCTATICEDGKITLRLRLPNALSQKHGKYLILPKIKFKYGHENILANLKTCLERKADPKKKHLGQAICYRFKKDQKGWRVFASITLEKPKQITKEGLGVIGIDINANHLAVVETDRFGNYLTKQTIALNTYGKSKNQALALIGDACNTIIQKAKNTKKPIIIEKLDFKKKKACLKAQNFKKHSRMLSSLCYNKIIEFLHSGAYRHGIAIHTVNPAYTSMIGMVKFAKRYGLSKHHAAALCIARRMFKFSEQPPKSSIKITDGKQGLFTLPLPVRNRGKHVWSWWGALNRNYQTVLAAHLRAKKYRSLRSANADLRDKKIPRVVGEIPARESLATLLG